MAEHILLKNDFLTVDISTMGAEIQSVLDKDGTERIWNGDAQFWTGRAPVLFPFAGGMKDDYFLYRGKKYAIAKHGFARRKEFKAETVTENSATFLLDEPVADYPFDYALRLRYTLEGNAIKVDYIVSNNGNDHMYYSVGCHEAYMAPGGVENYRLVFDKEETLLNYPLEANCVGHVPEQLTCNEKVLPLKEEYFAVDALMFLEVNSRGVTLENSLNEKKVRVDFPGFDYLLVWKKPNAPYVAIEPWHNAPEFVDAGHELITKTGIVHLFAGEEKTHTHLITFIG